VIKDIVASNIIADSQEGLAITGIIPASIPITDIMPVTRVKISGRNSSQSGIM